MARAKAGLRTKAKTRSSKHSSKAFSKVLAPDVPVDSDGKGSSSSLDDDASGEREATDRTNSSFERDAPERAPDPESSLSSVGECEHGCTAACLAETARLREDAARYFKHYGLITRFALRSAHLPELPPISTRYWSCDHQQIAWRSTPGKMRYHARLGDARLEYLVPLVLRKNYKRTNLPEISICCSSPDASKLLISEYQVAVRYLQSNKVLGGLAFAYGFRDDGVARTPQEHLHYYADMLEAFIETVFTARDGHAVGLKWLRALWSSRCFPDLHSYVEEHSSNDGMPYEYSDLGRAYACWKRKRKGALRWKTV